MAKQPPKSGTSRIRFVMFDAEVPEGEIGQLTQAMQKALLGTTVIQRVQAPAALRAPDSNGQASEMEPDAEAEEEFEDVPPAAARQPRQKRAVPKMPKVLNIDMDSDVSLASFAQGKDSGSQHKKFLIAAAWLAEHRDTPGVNEDHIFTCFKSIGWPINIADFSQPLRDLKTKRQFFEKTERGYEINHLGLAYVKKLGNGAA
jgi:hypothetical protein